MSIKVFGRGADSFTGLNLPLSPMTPLASFQSLAPRAGAILLDYSAIEEYVPLYYHLSASHLSISCRVHTVTARGQVVANATEGQYKNRLRWGVITRREEIKTWRKDKYLVEFSPGDKENPKNWSNRKKWVVATAMLGVNVVISMISSGYSLGIPGVVRDLGGSTEGGTVGTTLFLVGRALGPLIIAPLSETYGRIPVMHVTVIGFAASLVGCALAVNLGMLLAFRFLSGFIGSIGSNVGGTLKDMWSHEEIGPSQCAFAVVVLAGPELGPIIYGWTYQRLGWRWIFWLQLILTGATELMILLVIPETREAAILTKRAKKKNKEENDDKWHAKEDYHNIAMGELVQTHLLLPGKMLVTEPVVVMLSLYGAFLFSLIFLNLGGISVVFETLYNFSPGQVGLAHLGDFVGYSAAALLYPIQEHLYQKRRRENNGEGCPEDRMLWSFVGAFLLPAGLFWYGWTNYASVLWIVPILSGLCYGLGSAMLFTSIFAYLVDSYRDVSSSAIAGLNFSRNILAAGFSLFARQMFQNLGFHWAPSTLGFISLGLAIIPFVIYKYGSKLREKSKTLKEMGGSKCFQGLLYTHHPPLLLDIPPNIQLSIVQGDHEGFILITSVKVMTDQSILQTRKCANYLYKKRRKKCSDVPDALIPPK
ncbi:hypothetical protein PROFUN_13441 [Planoprotostelium fungivorum]|uniref:Major facilitator superfamily (MFS) profile domain-containing protein n=1 Tax=Planoprotostelium fungivorum TaxID=1890364 RepID=A0A2P6N438_9EUKA|nr:hypothetical protein PROFUN_13441 [Planoprotostelium fungivorum]